MREFFKECYFDFEHAELVKEELLELEKEFNELEERFTNFQRNVAKIRKEAKKRSLK